MRFCEQMVVSFSLAESEQEDKNNGSSGIRGKGECESSPPESLRTKILRDLIVTLWPT